MLTALKMPTISSTPAMLSLIHILCMTTQKIDYPEDIAQILAHRYDNGADLWSTPDKKLLKGAPFTTLESVSYLLEAGLSPDDDILQEAAELIFSTWKEDGRFKTSPAGGIYPCHTALALNTLCRLGYASDSRLQRTFRYFLDTQEPDGGWKCNKYSFGRGPETEYSTPYTTPVSYTHLMNSISFWRGM